MRFVGQGILGVDELHIPCQANGPPYGMFREPTIIVTSSLPKPATGLGKSDDRYEQDVRDQGFGIVCRLSQIERSDRQVALAKWINMLGEGHWRCFALKAGKSNCMPALMEEARVAGGGRLGTGCVVQSYHSIVVNGLKDRPWRMMEEERADRTWLRGYVITARLSKGRPEFTLAWHRMSSKILRAIAAPTTQGMTGPPWAVP